jgi:hypothetical protein
VHRGASLAAQRVLGLVPPRHTEIAPCPLCKSHLRFDVDAIGRTVELCPNQQCPYSHGHVPSFDPADLIPERPRQKRKRKEIAELV